MQAWPCLAAELYTSLSTIHFTGALERKKAGYVVAALKALQSAALALPGVRNAEAMAKLLSLAKLDDHDLNSTSKVLS